MRDEKEEDIKRGQPRRRRNEEEGLTFTVASRSDGIFRLHLYQRRRLIAATHLLGTLLKISLTHSSRVSSFSEGHSKPRSTNQTSERLPLIPGENLSSWLWLKCGVGKWGEVGGWGAINRCTFEIIFEVFTGAGEDLYCQAPKDSTAARHDD